MVHVPVFGIDVPEPRLAELIPNAVTFIVTLGARGLDKIQENLYPLSEDDQETYFNHYMSNFPREFDKVHTRCLEGELDNSAHLSSEAEEASYDWYRRMIRTATVGATDDEQEDVTAFKLGLDAPSIQEEVRNRYEAEQERLNAVMDPFDEALFSKVSADPLIQLEARYSAQLEMQAIQRELTERKAAEREAEEERREWIENKLTGTRKVVALSTLNAGAGAALGLLLFRGLGMAWKFVFNPSARKTKAKNAARVKRQIEDRAAAKSSAAPSKAEKSKAAPAGKTAAAAADKTSKTSKTTATKTSARPTARKR
eukprot:gene23186-30398_t